ncbi:hypothetical protein [Konateibacter massiliensis]|uniref:hypothetical protein n=1 Tax=Konateibacter massiliensis TaxID=2002841 RepID=UPI000C148640|nr:hypothetical protein [Konateibacter massiliensis]
MSSQTSRKKTYSRTAMNSTTTYQHGNTVRQFQVMPNPVIPEIDKPRLSNRTRRNREKALSMNFGYVLFLAMAVVATVLVCVSYLTLQAEMTQRVKNISSLEQEVADLRSDNDETYNRINNSIDLKHIKQVALEEIGMVYASEGQVVLYENEESDYVRQYSDIPKAK